MGWFAAGVLVGLVAGCALALWLLCYAYARVAEPETREEID